MLPLQKLFLVKYPADGSKTEARHLSVITRMVVIINAFIKAKCSIAKKIFFYGSSQLWLKIKREMTIRIIVVTTKRGNDKFWDEQ